MVEKSLKPAKAGTPNQPRPNIVIIFADDLGYGDVGCYGAKGFATPNLDRMAAEGARFTDFYVAAPSCTPSRAALLTGCYPQRVGLPAVIGPRSKIGISAEETTLAELLKARGYATACIGKWHLGDAPQFLPTRHGFDEYFGLPYSNDMWPHHPEAKPGKGGYPPLPLIEGETVVKKGLTPDDQAQLTTWYAERAVKFIGKNKERPFFLYLAHSMPHVPLFVSDRFKGKAQRGLYGDVVMEIDWSVGQLLDALKANGLDDRTLVMFNSRTPTARSLAGLAARTANRPTTRCARSSNRSFTTWKTTSARRLTLPPNVPTWSSGSQRSPRRRARTWAIR